MILMFIVFKTEAHKKCGSASTLDVELADVVEYFPSSSPRSDRSICVIFAQPPKPSTHTDVYR